MTVGGTDVYLHAGTLLFGLYALMTGTWPMLLTACLSILLHECAHAAAAALAGQPPGEMELTPLGAVLRMEDEERLPVGRRLLMLAAGPAMTLLLCFLAISMTERGMLPQHVGRRLFTANLVILLLNLLPALPLDGGRMLLAVLSCFLRAEMVRKIVRISGALLGCAAVSCSIWLAWHTGGWNLSLAAAGCFLLYSGAQATTPYALSALREYMDRKLRLESRGHMSFCRTAVLDRVPLASAIRLLPRRRMTELTVIEAGTLRQIGSITEQQLISEYLDSPGRSCGDVCRGTGEA